MSGKYSFGKVVDLGFDEAVGKITETLKVEGFGILSEIDVAATLKKKMDLDMPPYRILGACNPPFAHRALEADPSIGALLPCNVVVRADKQGAVHVEIMDPDIITSFVDNPQIGELAVEVKSKLTRALDAL